MRVFLPVVALVFAACVPRATTPATPAADGRPAVPATPAPVIAPDANVVVVALEAVGEPERDFASYTKVFVDNIDVGQTQTEAKSKPKKWAARLKPGNHLFRLETWSMLPSGEWRALDAQWQPAERFVRLEDGKRAIITLKRFDGGLKHDLQVAREALAP